MGSKKVKAIVIDVHRMPNLMDRKKTLSAVKTYAGWVREDSAIQNTYNPIGTMASQRIFTYWSATRTR